MYSVMALIMQLGWYCGMKSFLKVHSTFHESNYFKFNFISAHECLMNASSHAKELQVVQNSMVRVILGLNRANHINMKEQREKIKMLSVNQMAVYHTVMEAYNITTKNASYQLQKKLKMHEGKHSERCAANNDLFVPENPPEKTVQVSPTLDRNYTTWYQKV